MKSLFVSSAVVAAFFSLSASADSKYPYLVGLEFVQTGKSLVNCPTDAQLLVKGSSRVYEGGAEVTGGIELTQFATNIEFIESKEQSVTWGATLKPKYAKCVAAAYDYVDADVPRFTLEFQDGKVYFTLSVEGTNSIGIPSEITYQNIKSGNPVFRYAIAD